MKKLLFCTSFILGSILCAQAHPHVFAKTALEFEFSGNQCLGVWVQWEFDQMFSLSMLQPVDANRNGKLEEDEVKALYDYGFKNLENYGYFVYIRVGEKRYHPRRVESFTAWMNGMLMNYRFFVPLERDTLGLSFHIAIFDSSFYTAISFKEPAVQIQQKTAGAPIPTWRLSPNRDFPIYYNPRGAANDFTVYSKWEPGLETAYPQEIHVFFQ